MTEDEKEALLRALDESAGLLERSVAGVPELHWMLSPGEGQWCPAEILEHVILTEESVSRNVVSGLPNGTAAVRELESARRFDSVILARVPDRTPGRPRIPAPEFLRPRGRCADRHEAMCEFRQQRESLKGFIDKAPSQLRERVARHPALGDIDGYQWLLFLAAHCTRHAKQLEEAGAVSKTSHAKP